MLPKKKIALKPINFANKVKIIKPCCGVNLPVADASSKIIDDLVNKLIFSIWNKKNIIGSSGQLIVAEAIALLGGLKKGYGVTTGYNTPDNLAYQLMEYNLFEFSASKTEARMAAMTDLLLDKEKNEIKSFDEFEKLANQKTQNLNKNYLETEYNLSISVGQNSAQYHRFMAEKNDFPFVEYQTVGDSKVRSEHAKLDGLVFSLDDKEARKLWPPNGYGCRCEMIQTNRRPTSVTTGLQGQEIINSEDARWSTGQFNINRGELNQVFTKKQFYSDIKGLPKMLNEMTFDKYDLKKWDAFKQDLNPIKLDQTITGTNVKELFKPEKNETFMRFKDYFGRKMILSKEVFDKHTTGKYLNKEEKRHQLFPNIKEVLSNPDEVWYNKPDEFEKLENIKIFQSRYIKFYQDMILIVDCKITNNNLNIYTWYMAKKEDLYLRKGLLIRNKVL